MAEPFKPNHEAAKPASRDLLPEPRFSELVKNRTKSPLSLNEFMYYLIYIEHNAENLQFFLWYSDFVQRWSRLSKRQRSTSPAWNIGCEEDDGAFRTCPLAAHKRATSEKMAKILAILDGTSEQEESVSSCRNTILESPSSDYGECEGFAASTRLPDNSKQPFRDELMRIARNYIDQGAPRQLKLSERDRALILKALQHTTHPTALLLAFTMTSNILREFSHPSFVQWSLHRNVNKPRMIFTCLIAVVGILLGLCLNIMLTASDVSAYFRVFGILILWPAITWLVAASTGLCIEMHLQRLRQQRSWETENPEENVEVHQAGSTTSFIARDDTTENKDSSPATSSRPRIYQKFWYGQYQKYKHSPGNSTSNAVTVSRSASVTHTELRANSLDNPVSAVGFSTVITGGHDKSRGHSSITTGADPQPKPSMQFLGPSNDYSREARYSSETHRPSIKQRIFTPTVATRNKDLHMMQDRLVLRAVVLGGLVSALITCVFLFLPSGGLFTASGAGR